MPTFLIFDLSNQINFFSESVDCEVMEEIFHQFLFQVNKKLNIQRFLKLNKFGNKFYNFILEKLSEKIILMKNNQIIK